VDNFRLEKTVNRLARVHLKRPLRRSVSPVASIGVSRCNLNRLFSDINVSQGSVATYARCGGIFSNRFTSNLLKNLLVKKS